MEALKTSCYRANHKDQDKGPQLPLEELAAAPSGATV